MISIALGHAWDHGLALIGFVRNLDSCIPGPIVGSEGNGKKHERYLLLLGAARFYDCAAAALLCCLAALLTQLGGSISRCDSRIDARPCDLQLRRLLKRIASDSRSM